MNQDTRRHFLGMLAGTSTALVAVTPGLDAAPLEGPTFKIPISDECDGALFVDITAVDILSLPKISQGAVIPVLPPTGRTVSDCVKFVPLTRKPARKSYSFLSLEVPREWSAEERDKFLSIFKEEHRVSSWMQVEESGFRQFLRIPLAQDENGKIDISNWRVDR